MHGLVKKDPRRLNYDGRESVGRLVGGGGAELREARDMFGEYGQLVIGQQ